jgi:hypothetical protein
MVAVRAVDAREPDPEMVPPESIRSSVEPASLDGGSVDSATKAPPVNGSAAIPEGSVSKPVWIGSRTYTEEHGRGSAPYAVAVRFLTSRSCPGPVLYCVMSVRGSVKVCALAAPADSRTMVLRRYTAPVACAGGASVSSVKWPVRLSSLTVALTRA